MQIVDADVVFLPKNGGVTGLHREQRYHSSLKGKEEPVPTLQSYADIWMPAYPWGENNGRPKYGS